ncbi:CBS domain-containing protein [Streptosporangium sp. NPDC051022]|uniref:CBS domain-containing protein n=1 Tax=Streptosporangium sp. NPDC051022 TaxID=3155752 RepID=UPI0034395CF5
MTMQVKDVMGLVAIAVHPETTFAELVATMHRFNVGAVAVIDAENRPIGVVSEDDLLLKEIDAPAGGGLFESHRRRQEHDRAIGTTAGQLMNRPALTVTRDTPLREAARLMHTRRIKQLPVIDAASGKIAGTVHQADLLKVFGRPAADILADMTEAVAGLGLNPEKLTITVDDCVVRVGGRLARRSQIAALVEAGRRVEGVAEVEADIAYDRDDLLRSPSISF